MSATAKMSDSMGLDLSALPPIYVMSANFSENDLHKAEDTVLDIDGRLTYDAKEARIFIGRISQKKRAAFELRRQGVWTEETPLPVEAASKKRKLTTKGEPEQDLNSSTTESVFDLLTSLENHIVVVKVDWLHKSVATEQLLPIQSHLVYSARITDKPEDEPSSTQTTPTKSQTVKYIDASSNRPSRTTSTPASTLTSSSAGLSSILDQTKFDADSSKTSAAPSWSPRRFRDQKNGHRTVLAQTHPALKRTTTSEHDFLTGHGTSSKLPPPPAWMLEPHPRANFACLRSTTMPYPNQAFIDQLSIIKEARLLTLDEIGVRAYGTSIASLAAYPHKFTSPVEITRLPGCSEKIAALWAEWYNSAEDGSPDSERSLSVVRDLLENEDLKILRLFYNIWGVGADTARKFYFDHGWKELDDLVEYSWTSLQRVQQIGVKFYDEFLIKIPRKEVEEIADTILHHARLCRGIPEEVWSNKENNHRGDWSKPDDGKGDQTWDPRDMVCVITGGYRRGKAECGDVDVILSHRDEEYTKDLVVDVVASLEQAGWITHTLTLHTTTSDRDQQTLPYKAGHTGHGFDSLDKVFCVWQDPGYDEEKHEKNPNLHRRIDIIVSPWRTVGAAVLGWSGATTFERDIRVWCRKKRDWKFDSSGVRDRISGEVLDLESPKTEDDGNCWEDRERRLMEGMGIGWRPARERCTG